MTSQRPRSSRPPSHHAEDPRRWADLRSRGSSFVVGALITLGAFSAGRLAGSPAEATAAAAERAQLPHEAERAQLPHEAAAPTGASPRPEPAGATELAVARTVHARELAVPEQQDAAPILSPSDLPLEEAKLDARGRGGKSKSRSVTRRRVGDGF